MGFIQRDVPNLCNDISFLQACLAGRAATGYSRDIDAPLGWQVVSECDIRIDGLETNPQIGPCKVSFLNDLLRHCLGCIHRDGKAQSFCYVAAAVLRTISVLIPITSPARFTKWSTGITMIDGRVGLDQILDLITVSSVDGAPRSR